MKCVKEMASGDMLCIPSFMKTGTGLQVISDFASAIWEAFHDDWFQHSKVVGGERDTCAETARWSHKPAFTFFKIRNVELGVVSADFLKLRTDCSFHIIQMWMCVIFIYTDLWERKVCIHNPNGLEAFRTEIWNRYPEISEHEVQNVSQNFLRWQ
jgi:hypothetical protein